MSERPDPNDSLGSIDQRLTAVVGDPETVPSFDLASIRVSTSDTFPLNLDIEAEVHNILAAGIFKNLETPSIYNKLCNMVYNDGYQNLVEALFWVIFVVKFQSDDEELLDKLRKNLGRRYSEYFSRLQQPKEQLSNNGILTAAYLSHIIFFNIFPKERDQFDMRFILDCYHIAIHEINGIFISDFYVQNAIEKTFGNKFFHFEKRVEKKKKVEKKDFRNEPLLRNLNYDLKDLPSIAGGLELANELSMKLRKGGRKFKPNTVMELNDSSNNKGMSQTHRPIMRLTQPAEEKSMLGGAEPAPYFPKLKFNCHQISPTVSGYLENSNSTLPFKTKKMIHYSNNKHITESTQIVLQNPKDVGVDIKSDRKDKKKNQTKGTVSDYKLKNRSENYSLAYMPKDIKDKYRFELDMKYILDNIRPSLQSDNTAKSYSEELSKKSNSLPFVLKSSFQNTIPEDQEEDVIDVSKNFRSARVEATTIESPYLHETSLREKREDNLEPFTLERPLKTTTDEATPMLNLPLINLKGKKYSKDDTSSATRRGSGFIGKIGDHSDRIKEEIEQIKKEEAKNMAKPDLLKFHAAANKKLGKGKFFVNLVDYEDGKETDEAKTSTKNYAYKDSRRQYIKEHDKLIRRDVEANIDNLVHRLMVKQSVFNRNFGRYAKSD